MSTPFSSPVNTTWQTLLDEITLAYSERLTVVYGPEGGYTPTEDTDVQRAGYWSTLQNFLELWCGAFVDHENGPLNPAGTEFLYFTLDTWRSAAGLNANGFRRVPDGVEWDGINDPVWSYGHMQAGDIIGPWIFEDLQKALSALKWTMESLTHSHYSESWYITEKVAGFLTPPLWLSGIQGVSEDCATARASHASQLAGISWEFGGNGDDVAVRYYRNFMSGTGDTHVWQSYQGTVKGYIQSIPAIAHSVDLYQSPRSEAGVPFFDFSGLGFSDGVLKFWESFPESTATSHTQTTPIGQNTTNGFTTLGWSCPTPEEGRSAGLWFDVPYWLFKWNFTNA